MITAHHLVFGRKYGETFTLDIQASRGMHYQFSTYEGDAYIDWGNGTYSNYSTPKLLDFTNYDRQTGFYAYANEMILMATPIDFTTKVRLNKGFKDVYSIAFFESGYRSSNSYPYGKFVINDFGIFINQFINLKTLIIDISRTNENADRKNTVKGDLSQIPDSLEKITIGSLQFQVNLTDLYLNVSNFSNTSNLKVFKRYSGAQSNIGTFTAYGNLAKLPSQLYYFKLDGNTGTFTYTGTKIWASSFDTLDIGNASLSVTETDNLLIDMANSITTAIGSKVIILANCNRTTASNTAVAYLQSLGFTITFAGITFLGNSDKILDFDVANPSSYIGSGTTIYDLSGYNNNGTLLNGIGFNTDSGGSLVFDGVDDKVSIADNSNLRTPNGTFSIWVKQVDDTSTRSAVASKISGSGSFNGWVIIINSTSIIVSIKNASTGYSLSYSINTSVWVNITLVWISTTTWKLYVNGVLRQTITTAPVTISNQPLCLGKSLDNYWYALKGRIGLVKAYSYTQSDGEVLTEFNNNKTRFGLL